MTKTKPKKREVTREKVIKAAINCIYKDGFNAAHTNHIAASAGVSWGVLQYHFGDKDGLLQAVLDYVFEDFLNTLTEAELAGESLSERLQSFIEVVWSLISRKEYRVTIAILRNAGKDRSSTINGQKQVKQWAAKMSQLWDNILQADTIAPEASDIARHLLFAGLRGLADDINPRVRLTRNSFAAERQALGESIAYLLQRNDAPRERA